MLLYSVLSMTRFGYVFILLSCVLTGFATRVERQFKPTWPQGTYGLMKFAHGCPLGGTTWSEGWRYQDTEDHDSRNTFTPEIGEFLAGGFQSNNLRTDFCIKKTFSQGSTDWPSGSYCILKYGNCPKGFQAGWIKWDDEDDDNTNKHGGVLPDGVYNHDTKIYYCCRNDSVGNDMALPTDYPFVLIRYGNHCQNVEGMEFRDVFIHWDDEDDDNKDSVSNPHPFDAGHSDNELHFCVYVIYGTVIG